MSWEPMSQEQFEETAIALKQKMREGNAEAAKYLGDLYFNGPNGDARDLKAAVPYWSRAVDGGEMSCLNNVIQAYLFGPDDVFNAQEGFRYCKISADQGDAKSQYNLGQCYEKGIGCSIDRTNAKVYLRKAALQGMGIAQFRLYQLMREDNDNEWEHWLHCAYVSGVKETIPILQKLVRNKEDREIFEDTIKKIKQNGWEPKHGGCYIATCVYGSYDCPQVWTLRRFRDNTLASSWYGQAFIRFYYAVSPSIVKRFGDTKWFRKMWKKYLDSMVKKLQSEGVDSSPYSDRKW